MANESAKLAHILDATIDANDPQILPEQAVKILAKVVKALAAKLDLDAGVTDTNYEAVIDAVTYE